MEDLKGVIEALTAAAKELGVGFIGVAVVFLAALAIFKLPGIIKAMSTFVNEYRKTSEEIEASQRRLDLEIRKKTRKFLRDQTKEAKR